MVMLFGLDEGFPMIRKYFNNVLGCKLAWLIERKSKSLLCKEEVIFKGPQRLFHGGSSLIDHVRIWMDTLSWVQIKPFLVVIGWQLKPNLIKWLLSQPPSSWVSTSRTWAWPELLIGFFMGFKFRPRAHFWLPHPSHIWKT